MNNSETIERLEMGYRMPRSATFEHPKNVYEKQLQCWDNDPDNRPTFVQLYSFFETYTRPKADMALNPAVGDVIASEADRQNVDSYEPEKTVKLYKDFGNDQSH